MKDIQQDQNIEVQTEKINNEYNNEENQTNTIIDNEELGDKDNTTINEVEDNNTKTEDVGETNTEKSDNKSEESTNLNKETDKEEKKTKNPKTGDNIVVYGIFGVIAWIGIAVIYKANK